MNKAKPYLPNLSQPATAYPETIAANELGLVAVYTSFCLYPSDVYLLKRW